MEITILVLCIGICLAVSPDQIQVDNAYPEENLGLFEGDIVLQPGENPMHRNAIKDKRRRWPGGVVPYEISSSYPNAVQNIFHAAMAEIENRSKVNGKTCIHFKPHAGESGFVKFVTGSGCHTPVGYIHRQSDVTIGHGCERQGTVMHELLHALGFWHEQSRTDRDNYVTVHLSNVQKGHEGNFNKYPTSYIDMLGQPYDYGSIMHYGAYAFAIDRSKMTIEPKQRGVTIGQRLHLSAIDVKEIQLLYECTQDHSAVSTSAPHVVTSGPHTTHSAVSTLAGTDSCTFEHNMCHWSNSHSDNTNWRRHAGKTPSTNTGPHTDPHGSSSAHYIYIEATGHTNQVAKLESKSFPGADYCVDFYYHMYGNGIGSLKLNIVVGSQTLHMGVWSGNHGDQWRHIRFGAHVHTHSDFKFEFEGDTGSNYHSDIAIDDVQIIPGSC